MRSTSSLVGVLPLLFNRLICCFTSSTEVSGFSSSMFRVWSMMFWTLRMFCVILRHSPTVQFGRTCFSISSSALVFCMMSDTSTMLGRFRSAAVGNLKVPDRTLKCRSNGGTGE